MHTLTIAIPTYNRGSRVIDRLRELLPQCTAEVEILIVDNASADNVEELVLAEIPEAKDCVRFHRNRGNVGLAANICRCYEVANGEWLWTLGDDDAVCDGAVDAILTALRSEGNIDTIGAFNFSTGIHQYPTREHYQDVSEYWQGLSKASAFSNALFLSSCLVRTDIALKNLRLAYLQVFSAAPHIAVVMAALNSGHSAIMLPYKIVEWEAPDVASQWSRVAVTAGLPLLLEIKGASDTVRQNLSNGINLVIPKPLLKMGLKNILFEREYGPAYWEVFYARLSPVLFGGQRFKVGLLSRFSRVCWKYPYLHRRLESLANAFVQNKPNASQGAERL